MHIDLPTHMARMDSDRSKVSAARPESISIRTTIPAFIAKQMRLKVGDILEWELDKTDNIWIATIRKKE